MTDLTPLKIARRDKLLETAEQVFIQLGFGGATMERLAKAAGMSKVTLYGYFPDKGAVFAAVADRVAARMQQAVETALAADTDTETRVATALIEKHRVVHQIMSQSPFASELFAAKAVTSQSRFAALDKEIEDQIADEISDPAVARMLFGAAMGIVNRAANFDVAAQDIKQLVGALVAQ